VENCSNYSTSSLLRDLAKRGKGRLSRNRTETSNVFHNKTPFQTPVYHSIQSRRSNHISTQSCTDLLQKHIAPRHLVDSRQRVLHNTHDGPVGLRCDNHTWDSSQLTDLSPCLQRLSQVQVHLISIEVSIVRGRHTTHNKHEYINLLSPKSTMLVISITNVIMLCPYIYKSHCSIKTMVNLFTFYWSLCGQGRSISRCMHVRPFAW